MLKSQEMTAFLFLILFWFRKQHADAHSVRVVHFEQHNASPPDWSFADNARAIMTKMHRPFVAPWIEKPQP